MSHAFYHDDRLFGRGNRIGDDASASIARDAHNVTSANYALAKLQQVGSVRPQIKFAVNNDLFFNGAAAGIGPSQVSRDSELRFGYKTENARDVRLQPVGTRSFLCTPNIRKGSVDPNLEYKLRSGVRVGFEGRSNLPVTEDGYVLNQSINEERVRPMESEVVDGWVLGGVHTRASKDNL